MKFWSPLFAAWWAPGSASTAPETPATAWAVPVRVNPNWVEPHTVALPQLTK